MVVGDEEKEDDKNGGGCLFYIDGSVGSVDQSTNQYIRRSMDHV